MYLQYRAVQGIHTVDNIFDIGILDLNHIESKGEF